jgi:hypothetical protein
MKPYSQKIREMTDAGYKPKQIYKKLRGAVTIAHIYKVRHAHGLAAKAEALAQPISQPSTGYAFDLAVPDRPSLWMRVKRWLLGDSK